VDIKYFVLVTYTAKRIDIMRAEIALATVSGKAYYLLVNELKKKRISFLNLKPGDPIPLEVKVVITTEGEKHKVNHNNVLVFEEKDDPSVIVNEAIRIVQGKQNYEKVSIGIDPGEVFGIAVVADGVVIEAQNSFSINETVNKVSKLVKQLITEQSSITVKIGDGVPKYKEILLHMLDEELPEKVILESVRETGTSRSPVKAKHRRGIRDIMSAIKIANRPGQQFQRRITTS
jgi:hypothetical protein